MLLYECSGEKDLLGKLQSVESGFTKADMSAATFEKRNLQDALFMQTRLAETDFNTAFNIVIGPESNYMKKAKFSRDGLFGLLFKYGLQVE